MGAAEGSMRARSARARTDLPLPEGPLRTRMGYGGVGRRAAVSHATTECQALVERLRRVCRGARGWGLGAADSGFGRGRADVDWRKAVLKLLVICQSREVISRTSPAGLARSRTIFEGKNGSPSKAMRRLTGCLGKSPKRAWASRVRSTVRNASGDGAVSVSL